MKIKSISAGKNLSSLGNETLKVSIQLDSGLETSVVVPAGISAGKFEAKIVPAENAIAEVKSVEKTLLEEEWTQESLDAKLTSLNLGGNTSIAISAAFWKADNVVGKKCVYAGFPKLLLLMFEGAKHGNPNLTVQEFMLVEESLEMAISDFKKMREYLISQGIEITVGAEGGFSPMNFTNLLVLEVMKTVFPNRQFGLDAAGSFRSKDLDYEQIVNDFGIAYLEDPFSDEDFERWQEVFAKFGSKIMVVGDDLTVTSANRIEEAVSKKTINAVIIKPNQNGTISGTLAAVQKAKNLGLKIIVSHRGEETDDDWIVDFALCVGADYVKFGGMDRGERVAKYNRLLELGMK